MPSNEQFASMIADLQRRLANLERPNRLDRSSITVDETGSTMDVRRALLDSPTVPLRAAQAVTSITDIANTLDFLTTVFFGDEEPVISPAAGDLWSPRGTIVLQWVSGVWAEIVDDTVGLALSDYRQTLVPSDNRVDIYWTVEPPAVALIGDFWFKTDANNLPYRWDGGQWVALLPIQSQSTNYVPGESGWAINPDGDSQFKDLTSFGQVSAPQLSADTIVLGGVDLATTLGGSSIGKILSARLAQQASNIACSTTRTKILELNCGTVQGGRTYRIKTDVLGDGAGTMAFTDRIKLDYVYTIDGTTPTTSSATMDGGFNDPYFQFGDYTWVSPQAEVDIASECQLKVALCAQVLSGAGTYGIYAGSSARSRPVMSLYDDGPSGARNDAAISLTGGGTTRFVKTFNPTWANGLQGATWNELANSAYCDIGNSSSYGNGCFGAVGYNSTDIISKLSGVVTPISLVCRWRPRTRATAGGLDVRFLSHNYATLSAFTNAWFPQQWDNPPADITSVNTFGNAVPGTTYDQSLGTTLFSQFRSGTRKGICIANSGSPSYNSQPDGSGTFYSYGSYQPQLIFTYDGTS